MLCVDVILPVLLLAPGRNPDVLYEAFCGQGEAIGQGAEVKEGDSDESDYTDIKIVY